MSQTINGQNKPENPSRVTRPGQRQQERMQRLARRKKRQRIVTSSIAAFLVLALGIAGTLLFQNYNDQRIATLNAHGTATAKVANAHASATAITIANATATVVAKNCFISTNGDAPAVPAVYASGVTPTSGPQTAPEISGKPVTLKDGLKYVDIKVGTGAEVKSGNTLSANYTGWLASTCAKFDSSFDSHTDQSGQAQPAQPFSGLVIGKGNVIKGWDEGLIGMKVGGIRRLYIPAALGYGAQGGGPIPPNADLIFDVLLLSAK